MHHCIQCKLYTAFAAAGAAEGTVRIVEDLASSLSEVFAREGSLGQGKSYAKTSVESIPNTVVDLDSNTEAPNRDNIPTDEPVIEPDDDTEKNINEISVSREAGFEGIIRSIQALLMDNAEFVMQETAGVQSISPELLGVLLICYLFSIFILPKRNVNKQNQGDPTLIPVDIHASEINRTEKNTRHERNDGDSHSSLTVDSTMEIDPDIHDHEHMSSKTVPVSFMRRSFDSFLFLALMPFRLSRFVLALSWKVVFSRQALLLLVYLFGWLFLSRLSRHRSLTIQRSARMRIFSIFCDFFLR